MVSWPSAIFFNGPALALAEIECPPIETRNQLRSVTDSGMRLAILSDRNDLTIRSARRHKGYLKMVHTRSMSRHLPLFIYAVLLIAALLTNSGCGKDGKSSAPPSPDEIAVTPMSSCAAGNTYQGTAWNQTPYAQINAVPYGYGMRNFHQDRQLIATQGFCGCTIGTQPMCDGTYGVVCIPGQILSQHRDIAWYQHGPGGIAFSGYGGYTAYTNVYDPPYVPQPVPRYRHRRGPPMPPTITSQPACSAQIGQTCTVGINSCGAAAYCRPLGPNQSLGVCAR